MLEGDDDELTRAPIEKVIINQYERLQEQNSQAGEEALTVTVKGAAERCQLGQKNDTLPPSAGNL